MNKFVEWLTPEKREKIYAAVAALAPILVTAGVILPGNVEPILAIVAAVLQAAAGTLALVNLKPTDAARWFGTVGRGVIYAGAVTVAGAVVALGIVTDEWATTALTYTSFGLTALASILAVVTPKFALDPVIVEEEDVDALVVDGAIVAGTVEKGEIVVDTVEVGTVPAQAEEDNSEPVG